MDLRTKQIAATVAVAIVVRLVFGYLARLDRRAVEAPNGEHGAIAASRLRAKGHLWLLGAFLAALLTLLFGLGAGGVNAASIASTLAFAGLTALCAWRASRNYGKAGRVATAEANPGARNEPKPVAKS